jgi:hypothetical protein
MWSSHQAELVSFAIDANARSTISRALDDLAIEPILFLLSSHKEDVEAHSPLLIPPAIQSWHERTARTIQEL